MAGIDWTSGRVDLVHLIEVSYLDAGGDPQTARWCGPRSRARSGVAAGPTGTRHQWESRVDSCALDWTLGPLSVAVQALSDLDLRVTTAGGDDALLEAAQRGRWRGRPIRMWLWDRAADTYQQRFEGVVDRDPGDVSYSGFALRATATMDVDAAWPGTRLPAKRSGPTEWSHKTVTVPGVMDPAYPLALAHSFHPGTNPAGADYLQSHPGKIVGPVLGQDTSSGIWRQCPFYGANLASGIGPPDNYFFFHVSPQPYCHVPEVWYEDLAAGTLVHVSEATNDLETFALFDPTMGPTGTNIRLAGVAATFPDFQSSPYPRLMARIAGPFRGQQYSAGAPENGAVQVLVGSGMALTQDYDILRHILNDSSMMGLSPSIWGSGAPLHLALGPDGPSGTTAYASLMGAVPKDFLDSPLRARDVLGELLMLIQADLALRWDPIQGAVRLYALRRRPSVGAQAAADWMIRRADLVHGGHPGAIPDCRQDSDPDGAYATDVQVVGATRYLPAETVAGGYPSNDVAPTTHEVARHRDSAEEALGPAVAASHGLKWWSHAPDPAGDGWVDGAEFLGALRSQPQRWLRSTLGWHHFGVQLCDTVAYAVPGVLDSVGQVRALRYDYGRGTVTVRSWHGVALSGAVPSGG